MSISRDIELLEKFSDITDSLSMKINITHDQVAEIVVAELMAKYRARLKRDVLDEYTIAFGDVLRFYLSEDEFNEMLKIFET